MKNEFKKQLAACRERSGLSYRALEKVSGITYSALAAMQGGHRPCGEQSARRLASAFGLSGETLDAFVLNALNTSRERVLESVKEYPAEVLNLLGLMLLGACIKPNRITGCGFDPRTPNCLKLFLNKGRTVHLYVEMSRSLGKRLHHHG
jgi:transcriptional regulator with XRE-family HTH domain